MMETEVNSLKGRGINPYQAVIMASREARAINDKVSMGIMEIQEKAATLALSKLLDGRIVLSEEEEIEA